MTIELPDLVPHQITVLTTSGCTARCGHCSVRAGPERSDRLSIEAILDPIREMHERNPVRLVVFAGGEPTLLGDDLLEAIASLDCRGIMTRLVTNASWASTPAEADEMVCLLREAGLCELNISTDDFHIPFIPLDHVLNAWRASKGVGFLAVAIAICSGPGSRVTPASVMALLGEELPLVFDETGVRMTLPCPAADGTVYAIANNNVYRIGRGRPLGARYVKLNGDVREIDIPCPWAVRSAAISPKGHLVACCGIEAEENRILDFGAIDRDGIRPLLRHANDDLILRAIAEIGPLRAMRVAREIDPGLEVPRTPGALCEACEDLVTNESAIAALRRSPGALEAEILAMRAMRSLGLWPRQTPTSTLHFGGGADSE
jgi:hypothetical protein